MTQLSKLTLLLVLLFTSLSVMAQQLPVSIDNLTDQQLAQLVSKLQLSGLSDAELEAKAKEYGLSTDQILTLKRRMSLLPTSTVTPGGLNNKIDTYVERNKIAVQGPSNKSRDSAATLPVFGADIFDNENLSFEPNLTIATPKNYLLGTNDQLVIDVYGVSDNTKKLKITTEGDIRFPNLGPIKVAGLTVEAAREKIKQALVRIYPGIRNGTTSVQVAVGEIRSIHVTLMGEIKRPGNYTISALATLMNALYASGGPNDIGSFRNIELVRNGKTMVVFDLYDFLLKGDLSKNLLLQDEDVIRVRPYQTRVAFKGAVKKPAIFEVKETETAKDILDYAGGFADMGYKDQLRVSRFGANNKEILTVKSNELAGFKLVSGDTLTVDPLANLFVNRAQVTGAVYYPGAYGIKQMPTLKDLVMAAKPKEEAYFERALVRRLQADYTPAFINFSLSDVLNGKFNMPLEREDSVHIYKLNELREKYAVTINGEVNRSGVYDFFTNMTVQDLVLMAGGYKEGAALQKIEVSRRIKTANETADSLSYSLIKEIDLAQKNNSDLDFKLSPFDIVSIRRSPLYREQISVIIEGEVQYPGKYTLTGNRERLSDIVKRAGGVKPNAFTAGAVLIRNTYTNTTAADASLVNTKANLINTQSGKSQSVAATADSGLVKSLYEQQRLVGIELNKALEHPGNANDLFLEEGDILKVPRTLQTIQTFGVVNVPKQIAYRPGLGFRRAIMESGGFAVNAARKHAYVVYANGEVRNTRHFLFFRSYPAIKPGAELYVPARRPGSKLTVGETMGIVSGLGSLLGLIAVLINTTK